MSTTQLKELQELSQIFSQGKINPNQIQQLSALLTQVNGDDEKGKAAKSEHINFIGAPYFGRE